MYEYMQIWDCRALAGKSKALVVVEEAMEAVAVEAVEVEGTAVVAVVVHTEVRLLSLGFCLTAL